MSDMWSATPTFAARKKRMMTALMSVLILLGGVLAAVVMAQPASATTVPEPSARLDDRVQRQLRGSGRIASQFG